MKTFLKGCLYVAVALFFCCSSSPIIQYKHPEYCVKINVPITIGSFVDRTSEWVEIDLYKKKVLEEANFYRFQTISHRDYDAMFKKTMDSNFEKKLKNLSLDLVSFKKLNNQDQIKILKEFLNETPHLKIIFDTARSLGAEYLITGYFKESGGFKTAVLWIHNVHNEQEIANGIMKCSNGKPADIFAKVARKLFLELEKHRCVK